MQCHLIKSVVNFTRASQKYFKSPAEGDDVGESVTIEELERDTAEVASPVSHVDGDDDLDSESTASVEQKLHCIVILKACLERMAFLCPQSNWPL